MVFLSCRLAAGPGAARWPVMGRRPLQWASRRRLRVLSSYKMQKRVLLADEFSCVCFKASHSSALPLVMA